LKRDPFQIVIRPPEAPFEGRNSNLLNFPGQDFFKYSKSKYSLFVSCKQIISQPLSSILLDRASHFFSELIPLKF
jgi:hypothetical protein